MTRFVFLTLTTMLLSLFFVQPSLAQTEKGFRLNLGLVPGVNEVEFSDAYNSVTYELDDEAGINFNPMFVFRTNTDRAVGFVGAFGAFIRTHRGEDEFGDEAELTAYGVSLAPGLAINLSKRAHLEFKAEVGLGGADQSLSGYEDGTGPYYSFGLNAGSYFHLSDVFVLGGDIGYLAFGSDNEIENTNIDVDLFGDGLTLNLSLGFMF